MKTRIYISGINLVLSSDEIIELRKEYIGRNKHHRSFKIRGKIFTGLTDKEVEESDMITMSKKESMDYFPEMTIKILEENFSRVDINEMEKNLKKKIYEHNRENIRKIVRWSNSPENCYQTMIIETILENDSPVFLIIPSVFVKKMSVSASVDEGTGEFELLLYQRFNVNESVMEVYKGDKGTSSPTPRNVTKNNAIVTDNNTPSEYVPDEQVEKNSANIGLITDNKIETDETEVYLLDVNDEHIQFLLGKRTSTHIYKLILKNKENPKFFEFLQSDDTILIDYKNNLNFLFKGEKKELTSDNLIKIENMVLTKNEYFEIFGELINSIDIIKGIENTILLKEYKDVLKKDYFIYKQNIDNTFLLIGIDKNTHYNRNKYQAGKIPTAKNQLIPIESNKEYISTFNKLFQLKNHSEYNNIYYFEKEQTFYKRLEIFKSLYHGLDNEKYVSLSPYSTRNEMFEVVFDYNGKIILNDEELGTFNFYSPNKINAHTLYDVIPYWLWGNTENDNSKISDRIIALNNINSLITPIHTPKNLKIRLIVLLKFLRGEAF